MTDREKRLASGRKSYKKHREKRLAARRAAPKKKRPYVKMDPEKRLANYIKSAYGMTREEHAALLTKQNYRCAICYLDANKSLHGRLYVDHDHSTGVVRGLLCNNCNSGLGYFKDDARSIKQAIAYLEARI